MDLSVTDPGVRRTLQMHDLRDPGRVHTDLQPNNCSCRQPQTVTGVEPVQPMSFSPEGTLYEQAQPRKFGTDTGDACHNCGGITTRTGSCHTCTSCGSTTGCG